MKTNNKQSVADQRRTLHKNLDFVSAEAYKLLRTNVIFSLPDIEKGCRVIGITSSIRGEGKSTTAINLSYSFAETGKRVLLIDADLRLPSIAKKMTMKNEEGLSDTLIDESGNSNIRIFKTRLCDNWHIILSGSIPPNPSELLSSNRMMQLIQGLKKSYDFIVLDLPPVTVVTDALVTAKYIDGMLIVVQEDMTEKKSINECVRLIKMSGIKILGFVLSRVKENEHHYGKYKRYYRHYGHYYSHYSKGNSPTNN